MWTYVQKTGALLRNERLVGGGYSGRDEGLNNPAMQAVHDLGPIPQGGWTIVGPPVNTAEHGPFVLTLRPFDGTNTFGRTGFLMHGDKGAGPPQSASRGCIVIGRDIREEVWESGDRELLVVAEFTPQD